MIAWLRRVFDQQVRPRSQLHWLGVQYRVNRARFRLIFSALPHLWTHHYDFDWAYPVYTLRFRLERLERVLRRDEGVEGSSDRADEVKEFLRLLDDHENALDRCHPRPTGWEWRSDYTPEEKAANTAWINDVTDYEEKAWNDAWNLFRDKARSWWV